jgi:hypothetical protein
MYSTGAPPDTHLVGEVNGAPDADCIKNSPDHYSEAGKLKTEWGAKTMAYDPKRERIFVDTAEFGTGAHQRLPNTGGKMTTTSAAHMEYTGR